MTGMARARWFDRGPGAEQRHRKGSPEDLRGPNRVHVERAGQIGHRLTKSPGLEEDLRPSGSAAANTNQEVPVGSGSEPISGHGHADGKS